jgi:hypothetical protein
MRRVFQAGAAAVVLELLVAAPVAAQPSMNLFIGGFLPRSFESRENTDVIRQNSTFLTFDPKDFQAVTIGGELLVGFSDKFEGSLGIAFFTKSVPTLYRDLQNVSPNGTRSEIEQDLKLRVVPLTATVRFLPLGRREGIVPYLGTGVGILNFRYTESGQFVDTAGNVFQPTSPYVATGTATGPVFLGGVRVPIGSWGFGGEIRYQSAQGDLPSSQGFSGTKIDLGGFNYLFTLNVKF